MEMKKLILKRRREFDITISLTGVIPSLVFVYLLAVKISSFEIFVGQVGYIMSATMILFIMGINVGRKMLWSMLEEIIEKHRLAAIVETTLTLSHEINNPLLIINGNLELLENEISENRLPPNLKERLDIIKSHCERIKQAIVKMSNLTKPASQTIFDNTKMIDLGKSE